MSLCVQVRLHILLQLDGLAEWMPAMAEQVGAVFRSLVRYLQVLETTPSRTRGDCTLQLTYRIRVESKLISHHFSHEHKHQVKIYRGDYLALFLVAGGSVHAQ